MISWRKLFKNIPHRILIKRGAEYEIVWCEELVKDGNLGETRFDPNQIVISKKQTAKEAVHTYWHEVLHAISAEFDVDLTERQVRQLERALYYILKPDNLFKKG